MAKGDAQRYSFEGNPIIKRIHLLSETEVADLYAQPKFSTNEQELYFTLNKSELAKPRLLEGKFSQLSIFGGSSTGPLLETKKAPLFVSQYG
ncbi:MAG: DUF4158 domain-containing protein [bacterium]|nr:DUF4158 domain-containing protein [bacterium]